MLAWVSYLREQQMSYLRLIYPHWSRVLRFFGETPKPQLLFSGLLLLIIGSCAVFLGNGPTPWEEGIQAAEEAGRKLKAHHYSVTWLWWCAIGILAIALLCLPFAGWLTTTLSEKFPTKRLPNPGVAWRWIMLSVVGSIVFASFYTVPRLGYSLWFDEEFMLRKQVLADYLRRDERLKPDLFAPVKRRDNQWRELLWFYEMPNNHPPVAVMGWIGQKWFAKDLTPDRPKGYYFHESAYRFPSWVGGMLSLGAVSVMLGIFGFGRAALLAPWILALHPWFLRYASEARGYVFLFLFGPLCVIALIRALQTGTWKWWLAFGLAEFCYLYFNASGIYVLVLLNCGAVAAFALNREWQKSDRLTLAKRWFVANTFGALAFLLLMGPCLLTLHDRFFPNPKIAEIMGPDLMADMAASLATGMRWFEWGGPEHPLALVLSDWHDSAPILISVFLLSLLGLLAWGAASLWKKGGIYRWIALAFLVSMPCFYLSSYLKGLQLYVWYIIYVLPLLWAIVAIGFDSLGDWIGKRTPLSPSIAFLVPAILFLTGFAILTHPMRIHVRNNPVEPARESVELTREIVNPFAPGFDEVITVGFNKYTRAYDPGFHQARTYEDLLTLLALADETGKPLFVNYAMPGLARGAFPRIMAAVDDETVFERTATLYGLEPTTTRFVRKYIPGSRSNLPTSQ